MPEKPSSYGPAPSSAAKKRKNILRGAGSKYLAAKALQDYSSQELFNELVRRAMLNLSSD